MQTKSDASTAAAVGRCSMGKAILCQGIHCPNRSECLHNARYLAAPLAERRGGKAD